MTDSAGLYRLTAAELGQGFRERAFTPLDALASIHARIDLLNPRLNAVVAEDRGAARQAAGAASERWRAQAPLSPLDGVPVTIKDNLYVAGLPASWGTRLHQGYMPEADEPAISRLRAAGLVFIGKTNVPEFTLQGYTDNLVFGATRNPLAPDRTPGGSTGGGAAAVAAGMGPIAIGTDGGGSLRRPAAHCGLFGLKPSIGQIARGGGFPQILADFEVIGPLTRSAPDLAMAFEILRGAEARDLRSLANHTPGAAFPRPARIGYFANVDGLPVDPRIVMAANGFARALGAAGHVVEEIPAPFEAAAVDAAWGAIAQAGLAWYLSRFPEADALVGGHARITARAGSRLSAGDYLAALDATLAMRNEAGGLFDRFDLLLSPTIAALAWPAGEAFPPIIDGRPAGPRGHAAFTAWANVAGLAAVSVPLINTPDAGGIGVQLMVAPGRDRELIDFIVGLPEISASRPTGPAEED